MQIYVYVSICMHLLLKVLLRIQPKNEAKLTEMAQTLFMQVTHWFWYTVPSGQMKQLIGTSCILITCSLLLKNAPPHTEIITSMDCNQVAGEVIFKFVKMTIPPSATAMLHYCHYYCWNDDSAHAYTVDLLIICMSASTWITCMMPSEREELEIESSDIGDSRQLSKFAHP